MSDHCQQLPRLIGSLAFPARGAGPVLVLHQPSPPPSGETEQKGWVTRPTWCSPKNWPSIAEKSLNVDDKAAN